MGFSLDNQPNKKKNLREGLMDHSEVREIKEKDFNNREQQMQLKLKGPKHPCKMNDQSIINNQTTHTFYDTIQKNWHFSPFR